MSTQPSPEVRVQYFAAARELCGCSEERIALDTACDARAFLQRLGERHARLGALAHRMRLAINGEIASDTELVHAGDEVAVLPPVAGGSGDPAPRATPHVQSSPLSVDAAIAAVSHPGAGGITVFIGTVRDHADGKSVARLDYEAHVTLAEQEMVRVLDEVHARFPTARVHAVHRIGELSIGDLAVVVAASAAHRAEAFDACRDAIEKIKERVPVWKKEWAPDGGAHWVNLEG
jgi:molybdopterin synthase catalytic subunit